MENHLFKTGSDPYVYSDFGSIDLSNHPKLQEGWEIVEGYPPVGAILYKEKTLSEVLDEVYNSQPAIKRAQYAPLKAAVNLLLEQGDIEAVKALIQGADVPEEDIQLKEIMLQLLK